MSEILHRLNTLQTLEYLALGTLSRILNTAIELKVWMTIVESGWNVWDVWVWLVGVGSRRRVWLVGVGGKYGCG